MPKATMAACWLTERHPAISHYDVMERPDHKLTRADYYRRRGFEAEQRAGRVTDLRLKQAFKDAAHSWFLLAEQVAWLDRRPRR
jgi:hypothetical protein